MEKSFVYGIAVTDYNSRQTWCVYAVLLLNVTLFIPRCVSYISQIPFSLFGSEKDLSDIPAYLDFLNQGLKNYKK